MLAVVGRPNVGKSTLVNRIIGRREAVVEDVPGVTRDRVSYDATWNGRAFTVVDTGGWDPDARGLAERIAGQAEIAVTLADAVLFVVDATVGITDHDEAVVKILRRSGKPVVLAANKVDDQRTEAEALGLWNLGLGEPHAVSALHGRGSGDMLDAILAALPETPPETFGTVGGPRRIAIVGKPNVGKSSLLNKLAGSERVVVDNVAGTTVDPVDELVELGGRTWRFIDTAGIRKRVKEASGHEYYASLRTSTAIDRAEVAVLVLDGGEPISEQDVRILQTVREAGRALVIAFNKWDLVDEDRQYYLDPRDRAGPGPGAVGTADQRHRAHRLARRPARPRPRQGARGLGDPGHHGRAQRLPRSAGRRAPAPGAQRQAAADPLRHPAVHGAADLRAVHLGQARRVLRTVHRAPAPRGVRLRRHPDRDQPEATGEAEALTPAASGAGAPAAWPSRSPPACSSSSRAAARPEPTIRSSWWNSSSPTPIDDGDTTQAPCARAVGDGAAAADHHGAQQRLAEGGDPGRPGPDPARPAHADVDGDDRSLVALGEQVDGQVVEHAAVDEQATVLLRDRGEQDRQPDRRERRVDEVAAARAPAGCGTRGRR